MKKYYVMMKQGAIGWGYSVLARDSKVARNKAVKRAVFETKDKAITLANVESVTYEGFYLARRFFAVNVELTLN